MNPKCAIFFRTVYSIDMSKNIGKIVWLEYSHPLSEKCLYSTTSCVYHNMQETKRNFFVFSIFSSESMSYKISSYAGVKE
jgi:hypothetical protein